jgi:hypothetical protein
VHLLERGWGRPAQPMTSRRCLPTTRRRLCPRDCRVAEIICERITWREPHDHSADASQRRRLKLTILFAPGTQRESFDRLHAELS